MNEIRSVLLHQDASEASVRRVHLAHRIAAAHGALLEVLYAVTPALLQYPMATSADSQLAAMLESGNLAPYRPTVPPNTHWSFWPKGGAR